MDLVLIRAARRAAGLSPAMALALAALVLCLAGPNAHAEGTAGVGAGLFSTHCAECHSLREGKDKKGPSLYAILGKKAAANAGFVYSDAMRASALSWTAENLDAYIAAPAKRVPGGKMKYDGLPQAAERADLIAYLVGAAGK
jgi:cytochrome c